MFAVVPSRGQLPPKGHKINVRGHDVTDGQGKNKLVIIYQDIVDKKSKIVELYAKSCQAISFDGYYLNGKG